MRSGLGKAGSIPKASSSNKQNCTPAYAYAWAYAWNFFDERPGLTVFRVEGPDAFNTFKNESGGHRWQRIPPNEKRGRVHTSTVTVAVLNEVQSSDFALKPEDIEFTATRGSGAGGQNRNKVNSCVVLKHRPTGLQVRVETERSQHRNRELAEALLRTKLFERDRESKAQGLNDVRRAQVGSGMRGDKRRTIRTQDDVTVDHVLDKRVQTSKYLRGYFPGVWRD